VTALRVAVLISGRGSNLAAILQAIERGACDAQVVRVVSDRASAAGLVTAAERGIRTELVRMADHASREAWDEALAQRVAEAEPELVVLAGFMRVVGPAFLARFPDRIINVHPALLPLFPGTDGPAQALAAKVRISGCSVHVVDAGIDTGPILAQAAVRVLPDDSVESLHERIQRAEHQLLPRVVHAIARGVIRLSPWIQIDARDDGALFCSPLLADDPT
jgi:phosphoribosylglycinamide formyltransferase-1